MSPRAWHPAVAVILLLLLGLLATLQYRWVGEISTAERERLQASLRTRGAGFAEAVDRDLTRTYAAFQVSPSTFERDPAGTLADAAARVATETACGASIRAVYVVAPGTDRGLRQLNLQERRLEETTWPQELSTLRGRIAALPTTAVAGLPLLPGLFNDPIDRSAPGFIVAVTAPAPPLDRQPGGVVVRSVPEQKPWHAVVVWLDEERLKERLLAPLAEQQFGSPDASEFNLAVMADSDRRPIYQSARSAVDPAAADFTSGLFAIRLNELVWTAPARPDAAGDGTAPAMKDQVSITIFRREATAGDPGVPHVVRQGAAWTLAVQAKRGSLDAVVARSRTRNLTLSLGVLGVLGAGLGLLLVASAREQRLARQQIEFVASVSHELRTPLAVIRSAAENLADGVVAGDSVREYGALIGGEGRRLSEMVERVMDFAGLTAGSLIRTRRAVAVAEVLAAAAATIAGDAREHGIELELRCPADVPAVIGDADALQSALQNVLGNAVKYSERGGRVEVDVTATAGGIRITVADRGIGIDASDLRHVFEPFFRGRRAVDSQVRGSGVGLSVMRKIVEAHGGHVDIAQRSGGGTVLTIVLPVPAATEEA